MNDEVNWELTKEGKEKLPYIEKRIQTIKTLAQKIKFKFENSYASQKQEEVIKDENGNIIEEFIEVPDYKDKRYKVSNLGRIQRRIGNEYVIVPQILYNGNLYMDKNAFEKKNTKYKNIQINTSKPIYRFVAETWLKKTTTNERWEVHHVDNNEYNNEVNNLIWVTSEQHREIHK